MKKCHKCNKTKDETEFYKDKSKKDGLSSYCQECRKCISKQTYRENEEDIKIKNKKYRQERSEEIKIQKKTWCEKNKDHVKNKKKQWAEENKQRVKENNSKWRSNNKEHIKDKHKEWEKENPQAVFNINARRRALIGNQEITKEEWLSVMKLTDWKCFYCDCSLSDKKVRTVDHIIPLVRGGRHHVDNLVPCCRKCNSSKKDKLFTEWNKLSDSKKTYLLNRLKESSLKTN